MSIKDIPQKIKPYLTEKVKPLIYKAKSHFELKEDVFLIISIILIGLAGFGLGKLSMMEKGRDPVQIKPAQTVILPSGDASFIPVTSSTTKSSDMGVNSNVSLSASAMIASESAKGLLVASKTGKKYHFPWCAGASQIAEKNKIWFNSYEEAQKAGYTAAANCAGLK